MALSVDLSAVTTSDGTLSAAGATAWLTVKDRTATLAGVASAAQGGTGIAYFTAAGPTVDRTYTFPDADSTILVSGGALGTPSSGVATNLTGTAAGLTAGNATLAATVTTNANLTGIVTSTGNATAIADKAISYTKLADGTDGNLITWDAAGVAALVATGTATHVLTSNGAGAAPTFQASVAGAATLDGITAAVADQAGIANADNFIRWNWAKTTNTEAAFELGESAAATGGTSSSGVPNQVLAKFSTLAASTMSPLSVYSRAAHVFSVSPTVAQLLATDGAVANPVYAFASAVNTGMYRSANGLQFAVAGTEKMRVNANSIKGPNGVVNEPTFSFLASDTTGIYRPAADEIGVALAAVENSRFIDSAFRVSKGTADAVSYAMNFRKSRGTVASPTVITTGDDLGTLDFFGYVGATNTYQSAARIVADSTGTISDSATGIAGILRFLAAGTAAAGSEPVECFQARGGGLSFPSSGAAATAGNAVLVNGTVTVSTTAIQTADFVLLTRKTSGGTLGTAITYTIIDATSFTITSDSALDTSTFSWAIIKASG